MASLLVLLTHMKVMRTTLSLQLITLCVLNFLLSKLISSKVLANHPLNVSDHLPVYSCFSISLSPPPAVTSGFSTPLTRSVLRWCNTDSRLIQSYSQAVDRALQSVSCDIHTPLDIELLSSSVSNALLSAGKDHIPSSKHHSYIRPNWSSDLKTAHNTSKQKYREWCLGGKPTTRVTLSRWRTRRPSVLFGGPSANLNVARWMNSITH